MKLLPLLAALALVSLPALASPTESFLRVESEQATLHIAVYPAEGTPIGDVLFFHGFGDRALNHGALFHHWQEAGLRVLAFDLPGHGETISQDLDNYNFNDLATLASQVEAATRESASRPLFFAGWSLGGLIATRIAQAPELAGRFGRLVSGLVLFAPGISVYPCVGRYCFVTNDTLTHDSRLWTRKFQPESPLYVPLFSADLLYNSQLALEERLPRRLPTLAFLAGEEEDHYAKTPEVKAWAVRQRDAYGANVSLYQCPGAYHELDNELPKFGGDQVRALSATFLESLAGAEEPNETGFAGQAPCRSI